MNYWHNRNWKGNLKRYNMRKSYSSKLRSSQCKISGIELKNVSPRRKSSQLTHTHKIKIETPHNVKKLCSPSYEKHHPISYKSMSQRKEYNKQKLLAKETYNNTDKKNLVSPKHNDDDNDPPHRKTYNIRKRFTKETSSNTNINNSKSPEQINKNDNNDKSDSSASHEPHRKIYNTRKRLTKKTFRNTNVNNSKSSEQLNDRDNEDSESSSSSHYEPPRKAYNTRKQNSNNYGNLSTSENYDFISIGGMKNVKAVRWDHPTFKSNSKQSSEKKCGMVVKNITIENICKFNNIHYSKPAFNNTQFSRIYVDELNMLLSINPIPNNDNLISANGRIATKRKCKVLRECSLADINQQSDKTREEMEQSYPQTLKNVLPYSNFPDFNNEFPKIFLKRLCVPSTTQSNNLLLFNTMCRLNETSYRKKFASQDELHNYELNDSFQKVNKVSDCVLSVNIENMEQQKMVNGFVNHKVDIVGEKRYPLRNRHAILTD